MAQPAESWHLPLQTFVLRRRNAGILQRLVERDSYLIRRHGSIHFLSIHKHRRSRFHADVFSFVHRGAHRLFILGFDACLQLGHVEIVPLRLQHGQLVEFRILAVAAFFGLIAC